MKAAEEAGKIKLGKACEELNDLQIKQILLEASQKEQLAALLSSDRKQGRMSMEHGTRLLKKTLEETVSTLVQEGDRERQELEERKLQLWEENEQMIEEHFKEEETLRLQISNAKEMERLRQYYETKLKEMGDELAALEQELPPPSSRLPSLPPVTCIFCEVTMPIGTSQDIYLQHLEVPPLTF